MSKYSLDLDPVFRALAHPARRAVVERLGKGPAATTELAEPFDMALPSFVQHMDVLEACRLVRSRKVGRVRWYRLAPRPLEAAEDWLAERRAMWEKRLDQLDEHLQTLKETDDG